jgi:hypothetical protein
LRMLGLRIPNFIPAASPIRHSGASNNEAWKAI